MRPARLLGLAVATLLPSPALATWSIVGVDLETGAVGAAGATCGPFVWYVAEVVPDEGAVVSLCATRIQSRKVAADALAEGDTPEEALARITDPDFDTRLDLRQFAIAGLDGPSAVYTGEDCPPWQGAHADVDFAVLGNTLAGEEVRDEAVAAWHGAAGEPLADRLLLALEAGADEGGDTRCDPDVAAKSAFLMVAESGDDQPSIELTASSQEGAVAELRAKYDDGRLTNCHCASASPAPLGGLLLAPLLALRRRRPT